MKDGENESYHEWLARTKREAEGAEIKSRNINRLRILAFIAAWMVAAFFAAKCDGPDPRPPEPMPGITSPLPPCLDDTDHI